MLFPWKTRLPAVARTPPFHGWAYCTRHTSRWVTGFQADRRPVSCVLIPARTFGSSGKLPALKSTPVFQPNSLGLKGCSAMKTKAASVTGRYTSPVLGLYDIGCQL